MRQNYRNYLGWTIKITIAVTTIVFLYSKLNNDKSILDLHTIINKLNVAPLAYTLTLVISLMAVNWLTEAYKWKLMMAKVHPIGYWSAVQTIVCGISLGTITPARVGDLVTRIIMIPPYKRVLGVIILSMSVFAQFVMYNVLACIAVPLFIYYYKPEYMDWVYLLMIAAPVYCAILLTLYFKISSFEKIMGRIKFLQPYKRFLSILSAYDYPFLMRLISISLFRFFILVVQYYLLIQLLIPSITFAQVTLMITLLFTIQSIVPTIEILDIGLRGVTTVYLFGFITNQHAAIVIVTSVIWLINLIIPSIIGLVLIIRLPQNRNANWLKVSN